MKRFALLLILTVLLQSCFNTPMIQYLFINNTTTIDVRVTPDSGEDWSGFTLAPAGQIMVESVKTNLFFIWDTGTDGVKSGAQLISPSNGNRTYTFEDFTPDL